MKKFTIFVIIGAGGTVFSYIIYLYLNMYLNYNVSFFIAYLLGIVYSYVMNSKIVFKTTLSIKKFSVFPLVYVVQYIFSALLLTFLVDQIRFSESWAPIIIAAITTPVTFLLSQYVLEKKT
ncbi:GtrA family protein [Vibrio sp. F74]|uniref:GtrA family protein n=1 Tax=Vibrio sp. F74 TaxID=700020 RepID=UPI0036F377AA